MSDEPEHSNNDDNDVEHSEPMLKDDGNDGMERGEETESGDEGGEEGGDNEHRAVEEGRKLFVGGLSYSTTDDGLKNYFLRFGELEESMVMREKTTGRSRGFGFVTFKHSAVAQQVVNDKDLMLDNRALHPEVALPKGTDKQRQVHDTVQKLYIGGVSYETTDDGFKNFFLKFGAIDDCVVMRDKITGESRGFGFVTFNEKDAMEKALEEKDTLLDGRNLDIKLAIPREEMERQEREKQFGRDPYRPPPVKKVFVRGLADKTSQAEFEGYFAKYGEITDAVIMVDRETQNPRGFGFVTFSDEAIVDKVVGQSHKIGGKLVTCEKAKPRESKRPEPAFDNRFERGPAYDRFDGRSFDRPQSGYRTYQPVEPARDYGYQAYTQPAAAGYDTRSQYVAAPGYDYSGGGGGYTTSQYTGQYTSGNVATTGYARNQDFSRAQTYQTRDRTSYHPYARR